MVKWLHRLVLYQLDGASKSENKKPDELWNIEVSVHEASIELCQFWLYITQKGKIDRIQSTLRSNSLLVRIVRA